MGTRARDAGVLKRGCVAAGEIAVVLRLRDLKGCERELLVNALQAVGMFGGMGSKSRKGYGSLMITKLEGATTWTAPTTTEELRRALADLAYPLDVPEADELPPYTAFSTSTRVVVLPAASGHSAMALLNRLGREMMRYRSWGKDGLVLGEKSEKNFTNDHHLMHDDPSNRDRHPLRIAFGLPHNYGDKPKDKVTPLGWDRRASPLLFHIHLLCRDKPVAVATFLPSIFLPRPAVINVGGQRIPLAEATLWQPIHTFLDRLLTDSSNGRREPFGTALEVRR